MTPSLRPPLRLPIGLLSAITLGGLLACRIGPRPPAELAGSGPGNPSAVIDAWETALTVDSGEVKVVLSERQLSAFLASRLGESERPVIDQAQVYLQNGQISIYGIASVGPLDAAALIVIQPVLDAAGSLAFEIISAELGPFPAPAAMMQALSDLLTEAFTGKLGSLATGIRITSLAIADGQVAIVGSLR